MSEDNLIESEMINLFREHAEHDPFDYFDVEDDIDVLEGKKYIFVAVVGRCHREAHKYRKPEALIKIYNNASCARAVEKGKKPLPIIAFALCGPEEMYVYIRRRRRRYYQILDYREDGDKMEKWLGICKRLLDNRFPQLQRYAPPL